MPLKTELICMMPSCKGVLGTQGDFRGLYQYGQDDTHKEYID
jgi:hypothetical protein